MDRRVYSAIGRSDCTSGPERKVDIWSQIKDLRKIFKWFTPLKTTIDTQNDCFRNGDWLKNCNFGYLCQISGVYVTIVVGCFFWGRIQYRGIMMNYIGPKYVLVPKREPQFERIAPENVPVSEEHGIELPLKAPQNVKTTFLVFGMLLFPVSTCWWLQVISDDIFTESPSDDPLFWSNVSRCF